MYKMIISLWQKSRDVISYLFFGALTTLVNYLVFFPLYNVVMMPVVPSNLLAWIAAVIFAFITNKQFVFHSANWSFSVVLSESVKFVACRLTSLLLETVCLFITVDLLDYNGNIWKIIISFLVIAVNYIGSKLFVFKKKP